MNQDLDKGLSPLWYREALARCRAELSDDTAFVVVLPTVYPDPPDSLLLPEEVARSKRYRLIADRRAFEIGRLIVRYFAANERAPILLTQHGKPYINAGIEFSISHTASAVSVALSICQPIGIDLETVPDHATLSSIVRLVCHPNELDWLAGLALVERPIGFTDLWTRKEALLKAEGCGLCNDLDALDVTPRSPNGALDVSGRWRLWSLLREAGFCCSLATSPSVVRVVMMTACDLSGARSRELNVEIDCDRR